MNRPGGLTRLPSSDLENSYFRAWALRGSEGSGSSSKTPLSNPPSPKSSPLVSSPPFGKVRRFDRHGQQTDTTPSNYSNVRSLLQYASEQIQSSRRGSREIHKSAKDRSSSQNSGRSDGQSSRKSSIASRARRLLSFSHGRGRKSISEDPATPSEAKKPGFYRNESQDRSSEAPLGRTRPSTGPSRLDSLSEDLVPMVFSSAQRIRQGGSPRNTPGTDLDTPKAGIVSSPIAVSSQETAKTGFKMQKSKSGVYKRTKQALGLSKPKIEKRETFVERTSTSDVLDRTSTALRHILVKHHTQERRMETPSTSTSASTLSIGAQRWQFLRATSGESSGSSGQGSLLAGKAPVPTPESQSLYIGSDKRHHLAIDLTDADGPTYLPSEARRVSTPPLPKTNSGRRKDLRGFFFDYTPPQDSGPSFIEEPLVEREKAPTIARKRSVVDWYRAELDAIEAEEDDDITHEDFELNVVEHLPSSPLCPRNPKHKSGGTGVCVFHGRNSPRPVPLPL